ncbi:MAG: acylphosphatase [Verrucomicrobiota bacterium]|jgi:acylphosphatase|nr:acylphosphatase [Verrucomicrobiota bacterium]
MKICRITYKGEVQGVGFRWTAQRISRLFDVTGWVRNLSSGEVELTAAGDEREVRAFLQAIRESELGVGISGELEAWAETETGFEGFSIRY